MNKADLTINVKGRLIDFSMPKVMGIVNVTPDSFIPGAVWPMGLAWLKRWPL